MENLVKFQKREIDRKIKVWGLVFRKLFRPVIADQEVRILQRVPLLEKPTLKKIMDIDYENKVVALAMRPVYITVATEEAENFLGRIGIFVKSVRPALLLDEKIFKYADNYSFAMAKYVNKTTSRRIKKEILSGLKEKLTWSKIATNIKKNIFKDLSMGYRSRMIARTEAHGMVENGSYEAAKASKIMKEKTWSSGADARPTHTDAHNQTVLLRDHFFVGGYLLDFPGDTSLGASMEEIIHCRCSVMYSSKIHKKRLTSSKNLLAQSPSTLSKKTAGRLRAEQKRLEKLLRDPKLSASRVKSRICEDLYYKLKDDLDYMRMVKFHQPVLYVETPKQAAMALNKRLIHQWAITSGDDNLLSIAMQMAVHDEFHLKKDLIHFSKQLIKLSKETHGIHAKALRGFVRAQYELTQAFFKKSGIKTVTCYRGTIGTLPKEFVKSFEGKMVKETIRLQPLSSFSTDSRLSSYFTISPRDAAVMQIEVPVQRIFSTCQTGFGCLKESELLILGGTDVVKIVPLGSKFIGIKRLDVKYLDLFGVPKKIPKLPKWKPTMTKTEANSWAKVGAFPDEILYHGTNSYNADKIKEAGFALKQETIGGKFLGDGVYITTNPKIAVQFENAAKLLGIGEGKTIPLKINIKNPYIISNLDDLNSLFASLNNKNIALKDAPKYLQSLGYDAIDASKWQADYGINIFNPKNIVVIGE